MSIIVIIIAILIGALENAVPSGFIGNRSPVIYFFLLSKYNITLSSPLL